METDVGSQARPRTLLRKELGKAVIVTNQVWTHCPHGAQTHSGAPRPVPTFPVRARNKLTYALKEKYLLSTHAGVIHTKETGDPNSCLHGADILTG